jgi:hypothetical protein
MMSKKKLLIFLLFLLATTSCMNGTHSETKADTISVQTKDSLPNDEFRRLIVKQLENEKDSKKLDTLITLLDKRGISFCQFIKRLIELDDSCYALAKHKFPDPSQQRDFSKVHDEAIENAEATYMKGLHLKESWALYAEIAYGFDKSIKDYCGRY